MQGVIVDTDDVEGMVLMSEEDSPGAMEGDSEEDFELQEMTLEGIAEEHERQLRRLYDDDDDFDGAALMDPSLNTARDATDGILVLDGLFQDEEVKQMQAACDALQFEPEYEYDFAAGEASDLDPMHPMVRRIIERVRPHARRLLSSQGLLRRQVEPWHMYRAYVNRFAHTDHPIPHQDATFEAHLTALVYPNSAWDMTDGAETVFYTDADFSNVARSVMPRPGRVVLFTGDTWHAARPPLPRCTDRRLSVAIKWGSLQELLGDPEEYGLEDFTGPAYDLANE